MSKRKKTLKTAVGEVEGVDADGDQNGDTCDPFCICRSTVYDGSFCVECSLCNGWFHGSCVGISDPSDQKKCTADGAIWICPSCTAAFATHPAIPCLMALRHVPLNTLPADFPTASSRKR